MAASPEQIDQTQLQPIEWGSNLARVDVRYLGTHNNYFELGAIRPDGSIAMFGELTSGGYDGARSKFTLSKEDEAAVPGRMLISRAVQSVMELEKLTEESLEYEVPKPPIGDWEPEAIATQGIQATLSELSLTRSVDRRLEELKEAGWVEKLNEILAQDDRIAVGLHGKGSEWSIIKLVGFQEYEYTNPGSADSQIGIRPVVKDRRETVGLRPVNARIERAFIKRN